MTLTFRVHVALCTIPNCALCTFIADVEEVAV